MLYMVVENYVAGPRPVYERTASHGRMLPDGLHFSPRPVIQVYNA